MITYNNENIESTFGCKVFRIDSDYTPAQIQEMIEVPGRNGSLILDSKRYPNVEMKYTAIFYDHEGVSADSHCRNLLSFLASTVGYKELYDNEHTDEYYMASVINDFEPIYDKDRSMVKVQIAFNRKPQRFLNSGKTSISISSDTTITNPTLFPSNPLIRVVGEGTFYIGATAITITSPGTAYVDIDSDMQDCFYGTQNLNDKVAFSGYKFPVLNPGNNGITFGTGISSITITPRWWRI